MARGTDLQMGTDWWFGWMVKDLERIRKLVTRMSREEVNPPPPPPPNAHQVWSYLCPV